MTQSPILLILGPSGAGKTTIGDYLAGQGLLHINFDRPDCCGVDHERFRAEWDAFLDDRDPLPLVQAIRHRVQAAGVSGASVTCPSGIIPTTMHGASGVELSREYLSQMVDAGLRTLVLYGCRDDCLAAFSRREAGAQTGLGQDWWDCNNAPWHQAFRPADFPGQVVTVFEGGQHRPLPMVVAEVRGRFGL